MLNDINLFLKLWHILKYWFNPKYHDLVCKRVKVIDIIESLERKEHVSEKDKIELVRELITDQNIITDGRYKAIDNVTL